MTFDKSEQSDWPPPKWKDKEPKEEEFAREIHTFTTENLEETVSVYDPETKTIRNEIKTGICSVCLKNTEKNNFAECFYGDQICAKCALFYNGRSICRKHVELHIGDKTEAIVLAGISAGLSKETVRKLGAFSVEQIGYSKLRILKKGYIRSGGFGILSKFPKLTPIGVESLYTMMSAFEKDPELVLLNEKIKLIKNVEPRTA